MLIDMSSTGERPLLYVTLSLVGAFVVWSSFKFYVNRKRFMEIRKQGLPTLPWNLISGDVTAMAKATASLPNDVHAHTLVDAFRRQNQLPPVFFVDSWPFGYQMIVVASPDVAYQITQEHSLPKFWSLQYFLKPLVGANNLVTMEGQLWKTWRGIFNSGFSASHLMTLVPGIVEDTLIYCDILRKHAEKGDLFVMEEMTTKLTVDIIGKIVLDHRLDTQHKENEFVTAFRKLSPWLSSGDEFNPFKRFNPIRAFIHWYHGRIMDRYLSRELDNRFAMRQDSSPDIKNKRSKPVVDLALDAYLAEQPKKATTQGLDPTFKEFAMSQMKTFLFAGHDTTSSTLCYAYYLLSKTPTAKQKICAEHDEVLGPDPSSAASLISANPHLLSKLPYTLAVIKETLRLFPAASSVRSGEKGYFITVDGRQYPTEGFMVWSVHYALGRAPEFWPQPDTFIPERWTVPEGDPLYPVKGAWRPFEFGPRNCIGQELAMLESKLILAMTVRTFDVVADYETWDKLHPRKGIKTVNGERAYQVLVGSAKPSDGLPCRVSLSKR